jgi:hypothetical protein
MLDIQYAMIALILQFHFDSDKHGSILFILVQVFRLGPFF